MVTFWNLIIYERFVIDWLVVGFLNKLNDRCDAAYDLHEENGLFVWHIVKIWKKKLSEIILFFKKLMEPLQIAFLVLWILIIYLHLYVPVQCTCRWIWYFFLFFNGVDSPDTRNLYDRQRQVLRINAIPSLQYVINFDWC